MHFSAARNRFMNAAPPAAVVTLLLAAFPISGSAQVELLHDMRAVHDMAVLDPGAAFGRLVVLRINPSRESGAGQVPERKDAPATIVETGTWELLDALGRNGIAPRGTFHWSKALRTHVNRLTAEDYYSPFSKGGIILCELDPERSGMEQFQRVSLLPASWERAPATAFEAVRKQRDAFREPPSSGVRHVLSSMAAGGEPLLAIMAFRRLLRTLNATELNALVTGSDSFVRAALVYLAVVDAHERRGGAAEKVLRGAVRQPTSVPVLRFTALGVFTARLLDPGIPGDCPWTTDVLAALQRAARQSGVATDPFFRPLFEIMGLRTP